MTPPPPKRDDFIRCRRRLHFTGAGGEDKERRARFGVAVSGPRCFRASRWKLRRTPVARVFVLSSHVCYRSARCSKWRLLFSSPPSLHPSLLHGFYFLPNTTTAHVCRGNRAPACFGLRAAVGTHLGAADGRLESLKKAEMAHQKSLLCKVCPPPPFFPLRVLF